MNKIAPFPGRRDFLKVSAALTTGSIGGLTLSPRANAASEDTELCIVGPKKGYTPQIGTLVSEMAFVRDQVLRSVKGMSGG